MGSLTPILNVMPVTHFRKAVLTVLRNWINISFMYIYIYMVCIQNKSYKWTETCNCWGKGFRDGWMDDIENESFRMIKKKRACVCLIAHRRLFTNWAECEKNCRWMEFEWNEVLLTADAERQSPHWGSVWVWSAVSETAALITGERGGMK